MGTSVLQLQETNSTNSHVSVEDDPKLQGGTLPDTLMERLSNIPSVAMSHLMTEIVR